MELEGFWSWGRSDLMYTQFWSAFYFNNLDNEAAYAVAKFVMTQNEEEVHGTFEGWHQNRG